MRTLDWRLRVSAIQGVCLRSGRSVKAAIGANSAAAAIHPSSDEIATLLELPLMLLSFQWLSM